MKKTVVALVSMFALLLSACSSLFTSTPGSEPTVDAAGTSAFQTALAQTLTAQPTLTSAFASETPTGPVESPVSSATDTPSPTLTATSGLTATSVTATVGSPTAVHSPVAMTFTATLAPGQLTASPTLGIRTYGTLPPAVPFSGITLINKAKAEAYISLQVTMPDGKYSILEYPVEGSRKIKAPVGYYVYVAWVGGRKMTGSFKLTQGDDLSITLYRDRVAIK